MNIPLIETERLYLREIAADDLDDLLEIWGNPEAMRLFPSTLNRGEMKAWIERNAKRYQQYNHGIWAVIRKSDGVLVGDCGLVLQEVDGVEELEVGYHFNPRYWGNGYATEAARGCMEYAFNQLGRRRLISMIRPENTSSRHVAERNGLHIEKELFWRGFQHLVYVKQMEDELICRT